MINKLIKSQEFFNTVVAKWAAFASIDAIRTDDLMPTRVQSNVGLRQLALDALVNLAVES